MWCTPRLATESRRPLAADAQVGVAKAIVVSSVLPSANVCVITVPETFSFRVPGLGPCIVLELAGSPLMVLVMETRVVDEDEMVIQGRVKV